MDKLIKAAFDARKKAYAPYSNFKVGAALQTTDGRVYTGCNVENSSYGLTVCAERVAIAKAVSDGAKKFKAMAVVTSSKKVEYPCGACRQVIAEFAPKIKIILANTKGDVKRTSISKLLPKVFRLK